MLRFMTALKVSESEKPTRTVLKRRPNLRQRILVVEDEADIRRLNAEVLICSGYQVDVAEDGLVGWEALQLNNYNLLVTDDTMPRMSGVELMKKLNAARIGLPVIMAAGTLPTWEFALYPWLHPAAMLLKPYTIEQFLRTVKAVLHATASGRKETAPPPNWPGQPAIGLNL
jgi:DNA-binding response OmpR family regulator